MTKPRRSCGIPEADYIGSRVRSRLVTGIGFVTVPITDPVAVSLVERPDVAVADARKRVTKPFNLVPPVLKIDHCSISRVSVTVTDDGKFYVSLRADQNAQFGQRPLEKTGGRGVVGQGFVPVEPGFVLQTGHIKRNEFLVRVRFYASKVDPNAKTLPLGGAVVAELVVPPFMVQRGEPLQHAFNGVCPDLSYYFGILDHIEVDFAFQ